MLRCSRMRRPWVKSAGVKLIVFLDSSGAGRSIGLLLLPWDFCVSEG